MKKVVDGATLSFLTSKVILPSSLMSPPCPCAKCCMLDIKLIFNMKPETSPLRPLEYQIPPSWKTWLHLCSVVADMHCSSYKMCYCCGQVRRSVQMVKPKSSSSLCFTLGRAAHSTSPTTAALSRTGKLPRTFCNSYCPSLRRRPTRNWRRRIGRNQLIFHLALRVFDYMLCKLCVPFAFCLPQTSKIDFNILLRHMKMFIL